MDKKKKVLFLMDHANAKTGFGRYAKSILEYLYKTNKYDITHLCTGTTQGNPELNSMPWECKGTINIEQLNQLKECNPPQAYGDLERVMAYGKFCVDEVVRQGKFDVCFFINDIWGV